MATVEEALDEAAVTRTDEGTLEAILQILVTGESLEAEFSFTGAEVSLGLDL